MMGNYSKERISTSKLLLKGSDDILKAFGIRDCRRDENVKSIQIASMIVCSFSAS